MLKGSGTIDAENIVTYEKYEFSGITSTIPTNRLDADQYSADDIDGVTESIFGSGNLAYASLQAAQTDASMTLGESLTLGSDYVPEQGMILLASYAGTPEGGAGAAYAPLIGGSIIPTDTDRALGTNDFSGPENLGAEGNFSNTTVGALGVSTLASDAGSFAFSSNPGIGGDINFDNRTGGSTSIVNSVTNIVNIDTGDTIENIVETVNETINNITNLGDEIVENILEGDVEEIVNIVSNQVNELTETINTEINNVTETVNNLLEETGITEITNQVTEITQDITGTVTNIVNEALDNALGGDLAINLDTDFLDSLGMGLHATIDGGISGNIDTALAGNNLSEVINDLTGLSVSPVSDVGVNVGFDILGGTGGDDGNDVSIVGIDTPTIDLGLAEGLAGDVDIEVNLPAELSDPGAFVEEVGGVLGSLDDISLADPEGILDVLSDQGVNGALEIVAGDTGLAQSYDEDLGGLLGQDSGSVSGGGLLEEIIGAAEDVASNTEDEMADLLGGGLDLNIDDAIGLLSSPDNGANPDDTVGGLPDEASDISWTESTLDAVGGLFDDIVGNGIGGGGSDALPDPVGTVAEGLGALPVDQPLSGGGLGGFFG